MLINYLPILVFILFAISLAIVVMILPKFFAKFKPTNNKLKGYECGFDPFENARKKFDIRFYIVAILFIIFDIEVAFLIPWAVKLKTITDMAFWSVMFFIFILTIGLVYEWKRGALDL